MMMFVRVVLHCDPAAIVCFPSRSITIGEFKKLVSLKLKIIPCQQYLYYGDTPLVDTNTLQDYGIQVNDVIQLIVGVPPPGQGTDIPKYIASGDVINLTNDGGADMYVDLTTDPIDDFTKWLLGNI